MIIEYIEDTIDIVLCNYIYAQVWKLPLFVHKIIRIFLRVNCYQYSTTGKPFRWEFRKNPPDVAFEQVEDKFGYTNILKENLQDRLNQMYIATKSLLNSGLDTRDNEI